MFVVEDVSEVDDLVGVVAHRQHGDLVQDVHRAVPQRAVGTRPGVVEVYHQIVTEQQNCKSFLLGCVTYLILDENLAAYSRPVSLCVHLRTVAQRPLK